MNIQNPVTQQTIHYGTIAKDNITEGTKKIIYDAAGGKERCLKGVVCCLACDSLVQGGLIALPYATPICQISVPTWIVNPLGAATALITCIGACCLYWNIPDKEFDELYQTLLESKRITMAILKENQEKIEQLETEIQNLEKNLIGCTNNATTLENTLKDLREMHNKEILIHEQTKNSLIETNSRLQNLENGACANLGNLDSFTNDNTYDDTYSTIAEFESIKLMLSETYNINSQNNYLTQDTNPINLS